MDADDLRLFLDVCRSGSPAATGRTHGRDAAWVDAAIVRLETALGFVLFADVAGLRRPTAAGATYAEQITEVLGRFDEGVSRARGRAEAEARESADLLRVSMPADLAHAGILRILPSFLERHPGLRVDLQLQGLPRSAGEVDQPPSGSDVELRWGATAAMGAESRRLADLRLRVCASPDYVERRGRPERPVDLTQHDCLALSKASAPAGSDVSGSEPPGVGARWRFRDAGALEIEVQLVPILRSSSLSALAQLARDGLGVSLQCEALIYQDLRVGALVDLFPGHDCGGGSGFADGIWAESLSQSEAAGAFLDYAEAALAAAPWSRGSGRPRAEGGEGCGHGV